jgi:sRNA-binding regulator protein Hfq
MSERKLIRPSMTEMMDKFPSRSTGRRKQVPAEQTNAESFYYLKQMQNRTPMVVVLDDGTELKGWIEWYDKTCIKLNRSDAPNLLLFKRSIKFMFKEEELRSRRRRRTPPPADR